MRFMQMHYLENFYVCFGSKVKLESFGVTGCKRSFLLNSCNLFMLHSIAMKLIHVHKLKIFYLFHGVKDKPWVIWCHRGLKVVFAKNSVSRPCKIACPQDSCICICLRPATYVMGSAVNLGSFGVTGVTFWFSLAKVVLNYQCNVAYSLDSYMH